MPQFTSRFVNAVPGDPLTENHRRQVHQALWSKVAATPVPAPQLLAWSREVAQQLGLDEALLCSEEGVAVLAGNGSWPGMEPYASNYGGHQFGNWAGQLGDGRAIVLGELVTPSGEILELQLKGAGPTPYSRRGDGRAVLRSSVREFLCSEAMYHLGIPTTRALSLVATGEEVIRDMFYDGRPEPEPGAIVCRVAPSFLRFGHFELCAQRGDLGLLKQLADFTLGFFPELPVGNDKARYAAFFRQVAERTARMVAQWQAMGFVHGVMNTDNMSILGLTIDYGPYGWVDNFDPSWTPNTTDAHERRYRYGQQPAVGLWNVECLGAALLPLLDGDRGMVAAGLEAYQHAFAQESSQRFSAKLGLRSLSRPGDEALLQEGFRWLAAHETDMTLFFRALSHEVQRLAPPPQISPRIHEAFYSPPSEEHLHRGLTWLTAWWERTRQEEAPPQVLAERMNAVNPKYVLRNWLAQNAIEAAQTGDVSEIHTLLEVMRHPFEEQPGKEAYAAKRPEWAKSKPGCSALSCSS